MHRKSLIVLACLALLLAPLLGCSKVKARSEAQKGNRFYKDELYKEALAQFQKALALDPGLTFVYRSLGFAAMAQFRPGTATAENMKYADTAIDAFQKYLKAYPNDEKVQDFLVATWVNAEKFDAALSFLKQQRRDHPETSKFNQPITNVYIKSNRYREALDWVGQFTPRDHGLYYLIATNAWSKSYNDPTTTFEDRVQIVDVGLQAVQRAVDVKPDYMEAMVYYNLLYREKAKLDPDDKKKEEYTAKADEWRAKALALRERQKPGTTAPASTATKPAA